MNILKTIIIVGLAVNSCSASTLTDAEFESALPTLTERERKQMIKFENPDAFSKAWKAAGIKLHEDFQKIRNKVHRPHHKVKKIVYVDEE